MNKKQRKAWGDFMAGTFTSGGIFDEPAKVTFKDPPKKEGPSLEELINRQIKQGAAVAGPAMDKKIADRIKKLEALANDPGATAAERHTAREMALKLRRG